MRYALLALALVFAAGCSDSSTSSGSGSSGSSGTSATTGGSSSGSSASTTTSGSTSGASGSTGVTGSATTTGTTTTGTTTTGTTTSGSTSGSTGNDWSCLGIVSHTTPTTSPGAWTLNFVDFQSNAPSTGITVKLCQFADTSCATPDDSQVTDSNGAATITIPFASDGDGGYFPYGGYLDVSDQANPASPSIAPMLYFQGPLENSFPSDGYVATVAPTEIGYVSQIAGLTLDDTRGQLIGVIFDCAGAAAADARVATDTADANSRTIYFSNQGGFEAPDSSATKTDTTGYFIVGNSPTGPGTASADLFLGGASIGQVDFIAREAVDAGGTMIPTISNVIIYPQ